MNKGLRLAQGQWLYFLGTDDQLYDRNVLLNLFNRPIESKIKIIIGRVQYDLKNNKAVYSHDKKGLIISKWSKMIWIKNTIHHQAAFYSKAVFKSYRFDLDYKILSDHALNIFLFKQKAPVLITGQVIALCGAAGLTKAFKWAMYKEEVALKVAASSIVFKPFFMLLALGKYLFKKMQL